MNRRVPSRADGQIRRAGGRLEDGRPDGGGTLIEVLVATVVMSSAIIVLVAGLVTLGGSSIQNRQVTTASIVARNYAEALELAVAQSGAWCHLTYPVASAVPAGYSVSAVFGACPASTPTDSSVPNGCDLGGHADRIDRAPAHGRAPDMSPRRRRGRGEDGAALELALLFLGAASLIVVALLNFASTSSQATTVTRTTRGTDYDADAAMQAAIATIRVSTTQGVVGTCSSYTPSFALNDPARPVRVDCFPLTGATASQRHVILSVCPSSVAPPCPDGAAVLRADVVFYDDQGVGRALSIQSWSNQ